MGDSLEVNRVAHYRGLRGVVKWVLSALEERWPPLDHRDPIQCLWARTSPPPRGTCRWCGLKAIGKRYRKLAWHKEPWGDCYRYYAMVRVRDYGRRLFTVAPCANCGATGQELDHIVPLRLAVLFGKREYVRALLPSNLQWLCQECHRDKTAGDMTYIQHYQRRILRPSMNLPVYDNYKRLSMSSLKVDCFQGVRGIKAVPGFTLRRDPSSPDSHQRDCIVSVSPLTSSNALFPWAWPTGNLVTWEWYRRTPLRNMRHRLVRSTMDLRYGTGIAPAGTVFAIIRKRKGLRLLTHKFGHCGVNVIIDKVDPSCLEFL